MIDVYTWSLPQYLAAVIITLQLFSGTVFHGQALRIYSKLTISFNFFKSIAWSGAWFFIAYTGGFFGGAV